MVATNFVKYNKTVNALKFNLGEGKHQHQIVLANFIVEMALPNQI